MKERLTILFLLLSSFLFSQDKDVFCTNGQKIFPLAYIVIPESDSSYIVEYYFRKSFWIKMTQDDTLINNLQVFQGRFFNFDNQKLILKENKKDKAIQCYKFNECDSVVLNIRNTFLLRELMWEVDDSAATYIGYKNKDYEEYCKQIPVLIDDYINICTDSLRIHLPEIRQKYLLEIMSIADQMKEYNKSISVSDYEIKKADMAEFLKNCSPCILDFTTMIIYINKDVDLFLHTCKELEQSGNWYPFYLPLVKVNNLDDIPVRRAIESLRESRMRTKTRRKLIRKLEKMDKNEG